MGTKWPWRRIRTLGGEGLASFLKPSRCHQMWTCTTLGIPLRMVCCASHSPEGVGVSPAPLLRGIPMDTNVVLDCGVTQLSAGKHDFWYHPKIISNSCPL